MPGLDLQLGDVEHRDRRGLRAGPAGGRDREVRAQRRRRLAPLAHRRVDVVHDRRRVRGDEVGDLRGVDARAAADRDEAVDPGVAREVGGLLEGVERRLHAGAVVDHHLDALGLDAARARARDGRSRRRPGSVTSSARVTPRRLSSQPASAAAPGPNLIGVASRVKTDSWSRSRSSVRHAPRADGSVPGGDRQPRAGPRGRRRRAPTCSPTTTSARPSRSTGRGATAAGRAPSCGPADAAQVVAVLAACRAHGAAVVPQGGNTGMVGAGVPRGGEVVLSTTRLTDARAGRPRRRAGRGRRGRHARRAAGPRARRGPRRRRRPRRARQRHRRRPRRHRRRRHARGAPRDGPRPRRRAAGGPGRRDDRRPARAAEGQRRLRPRRRCSSAARARWASSRACAGAWWPALPSRVAALIGLRLARAGRRRCWPTVRPRLPSLHAADFFLDEGLQLVLDHLRPARARAHALAGLRAARVRGARATRPTSWPPRWPRPGSRTRVVADDSAERERLWRFREAHAEAISAVGHPAQARRRRPARAAGRVRRARAARRWRAWRPARAWSSSATSATATSTSTCSASSPTTTRSTRRSCALAAACGGTISAEHGVGVAKARWLELARSPGELRAMARDQARARPRRAAQPGCRAAVTRSWTKASLSTTGAGRTNG